MEHFAALLPAAWSLRGHHSLGKSTRAMPGAKGLSCIPSQLRTSPLGPHISRSGETARTGRGGCRLWARGAHHTLPRRPTSSRHTCLKSPCCLPSRPTNARPPCAAGLKFPPRGRRAHLPRGQPQRPAAPCPPPSGPRRRSPRPPGRACTEAREPRGWGAERAGSPGAPLQRSQWQRRRQQQVERAPRRADLGLEIRRDSRLGGPLGWSSCPPRSDP